MPGKTWDQDVKEIGLLFGRAVSHAEAAKAHGEAAVAFEKHADAQLVAAGKKHGKGPQEIAAARKKPPTHRPAFALPGTVFRVRGLV